MSETSEKSFHIFFSWQSDLPPAVNTKLIRSALDNAVAEMNSAPAPNLSVKRDEATRNTSGSPDIAEKIFEKIRAADAFICDISKVGELKTSDGEIRKFINPNVAIELGYAIRVLGWDRIVLIVNKAYGNLVDDIPLDTRGHLALSYELKATSQATQPPKDAVSNAKGQLRAGMLEALTRITNSNPRRPEEREHKSTEEINRERDVKQLAKAFKWIHLNLLDRFIEALAEGRILFAGEALYDGLSTVVQSSSFKFADGQLQELFLAFYAAWAGCFKFAYAMDLHPSGTHAHFRMPGDVEVSVEQGEQFKYTCRQWKPLRKALHALLDYVRERYLEIDPTQTGQDALNDYLEHEKETKEMLKRIARGESGPRKQPPVKRPA